MSTRLFSCEMPYVRNKFIFIFYYVGKLLTVVGFITEYQTYKSESR